MKVKTIMTKDPIAIELPGNRDDLLRTMVKNNKTGLPILHKDGKGVAGMITRQDIFSKPEETQLPLLMQKDPPVVSPNITVREASKILLEKNIYHLPVVEGDTLVGIITPTDLLKLIEKNGSEAPVADYIRLPCVPLYEKTPLNVAIAMMRLSKIYALPVLNDEARLTGIITDRDIFNLSIVDGSLAISDLGLGDDEDEWTWEGLRNVMKLYYEVSRVTLPNKLVKDIMVSDPKSIFKKTSIAEAARLMLRNDYGQLPIRNHEDRLEAMIYELDLLVSLL
ncbi:MAG: CBS domain-containing protein [Thermoplasmata archaeon]|nr:CBS domain-containing protein [Thermoplasmata archaeon]